MKGMDGCIDETIISISLHDDFKLRMDGCMDEKKGMVALKLYMTISGWRILDLMDEMRRVVTC